MPNFPEAALQHMFNTAALGDTATIEGVSVTGIFDKEYLELLETAGSVPVFICSAQDLAAITPTVARGTTVTINATAYTIKNFEPENTGITKLVLSET